MLETVIFFGLQAPHVSCTYHTQVVRYVNLALSPILGRMKMVLEAISRNATIKVIALRPIRTPGCHAILKRA